MRKLIVSEWISLDGVFDADPAYFSKWWIPFDSPGRRKYIQETINNCEIMLYGRKTYEMLFPYWSSFNHNEQGVADKLNQGKKYVVSSNLKKGDWENTTILNKDFVSQVEKIKSENGGYILVQGSSTILKPLLEAGMVDELRLLMTPAIAGSGKRLFPEPVNINLVSPTFQLLDKNVVLLTYQPRTN